MVEHRPTPGRLSLSYCWPALGAQGYLSSDSGFISFAMSHWVRFCICAILGLVLLVFGFLVPAHIRAVDASVLESAGHRTPGPVQSGLNLVDQNKLGPAQMLAAAARDQHLPGRERLDAAIANLAALHPKWQTWGGPEPRFERLFELDTAAPKTVLEPATEFVIRLENRERVLDFLGASQHRLVKELLEFRAVTNTAMFPPSNSSSGQALDAALSICGLLDEADRLSSALSNSIYMLASSANHGGNSAQFEQVLLDFLSLGQRLNWVQLAEFVRPITDTETLRLQTMLVRKTDAGLPVLYTAVQLSGNPAGVATYLMTFSHTGLQDLGATFQFGSGAVKELLQRNQRLYFSRFRLEAGGEGSFVNFASSYCWQMPWFSLSMKWFFYLLAGFFLAAALHFARPAIPVLERPLQVRGFHVAREVLFALGFLLVVLLLSEPFIAQESQRVEFPFRLSLPTTGRLIAAGATRITPSVMNQSLLTLLLFFVLQGLLYTACLVKLAEIRRQKVPARLRLKLLENEDHLFDAGLYLGFVGTVICLILVSLGIIRFSLMAAYSSTSFGIIFVSVFKIFHLRPLRRKLVLEAEANGESVAPASRSTLVTSA